MILALVPRRIHRHGKLGDVAALEFADFADALLVNFVDTNDGMHRQVGSLDVFKFGFDLFFGRIDYDGSPLAKDQFLNFDETEQLAMTNVTGVDFVNLALAHKDDFEELFLSHLLILKPEGA